MRSATGLMLMAFILSTSIFGCRTRSDADQAGSETKDLPSIFQSERVLAYRGRSVAELDGLFKSAPSPTAFPSGYAIGIHLIPAGTRAPVPQVLTQSTKNLWKGKQFHPNRGIMLDEVIGPNLGVGADLKLMPMRQVLAVYGWDRLDAAALVDERPSVITDYRSFRSYNGDSLLTGDTRGWIDECRVIEPALPAVWLCRSTYNGIFWGHVVLQAAE